MRAAVIVSKDPRQAVEWYEITVIQANGKPLKGLTGGRPDEAAARAAMYFASHCVGNPAGGDLIAPDRVLRFIPESLRRCR